MQAELSVSPAQLSLSLFFCYFYVSGCCFVGKTLVLGINNSCTPPIPYKYQYPGPNSNITPQYPTYKLFHGYSYWISFLGQILLWGSFLFSQKGLSWGYEFWLGSIGGPVTPSSMCRRGSEDSGPELSSWIAQFDALSRWLTDCSCCGCNFISLIYGLIGIKIIVFLNV